MHGKLRRHNQLYERFGQLWTLRESLRYLGNLYRRVLYLWCRLYAMHGNVRQLDQSPERQQQLRKVLQFLFGRANLHGWHVSENHSVRSGDATSVVIPSESTVEPFRRNHERFPENFMFQLTTAEYAALMLQNATSKPGRGGRSASPPISKRSPDAR